MKKIKQPPIVQGKHISVQPSVAGSTQNLKPTFSFQYLVPTHSVEACEIDDRAALAVRLTKIGAMTWSEIQHAHRHGFGCEIIAQDSMKVPLPKVVTPDVKLLAFRFNGKKPMIGFRSDQVFNILFLDRDFTCYSH